MKKLLLTALVLIMTLSVLTACGTAAPDTGDIDQAAIATGNIDETESPDAAAFSTENKSYKKGAFDASSFESEYLNLRFTLPDGFIMASEEDMNQMMSIGAETMGIDEKLVDYAQLTTVYEMMAVAAAGSPNVIVMSEKLMLSGMSEDQYLGALQTQLASTTQMDYTFSDIEAVEIVGQSYKRITAITAAYGQELIQSYTFRKIDDRMVGFVATYTSETENELNTLMAAFTEH